MDALHADLPVIPICEFLDEAVLSQGPVILLNLVTLGKVRIEVVLSRPLRLQVDLAVQTQRCFHRHRDGYTIQDGQSSGQAKTHRARAKARVPSPANYEFNIFRARTGFDRKCRWM